MSEQVPQAMLQWAPLIESRSQLIGIDKFVYGGWIWKESSGNRYAKKIEPGYCYFYHPTQGALYDASLGTDSQSRVRENRGVALRLLGAAEFTFQTWSYGLIQIMGATAREMGFEAEPDQLYLPEINLSVGEKYLLLCIKRAHGDVHGGFQRYNGGGDLHYYDNILRRAVALKQL